MRISRLRSFVCATSWVLLASCSSSTGANGAGGAAGTLYLNAEIHATVYSFDLSSGNTKKLVSCADPYVTPQGTILCVSTAAGSSGDLGEYSADGTTFRTIVKQNFQAPYAVTYDDHFQNPQLSPDGKEVVYEGQFSVGYDIYVVDRATGALLASSNPPTVGIGFLRPTWTPNGRLVVAGHDNQGLYLSDATWTTFTRFDPGLASPSDPAVSPDGTSVAFVLNGQVYTLGIDGTGLKPIMTTSTTNSWPTWSPDGKSIAFYSDTSIFIAPVAGGASADIRNLSAAADNWMTFTSTHSGAFSWR